MRWILAGVTTAFLLVAYYGFSIPATVLEIMTSTEPDQNPLSTPKIPIRVTISPPTSPTPPSSTNSVLITVILENTSPHPLSILRWSSPFDPHAGALGIFSFTSKSTGRTAPCVDLKINHKIPDSGTFAHDAEDIVTIEAGGKVERTVEVKEHEVQLENGETYIVKAKGGWVGVWVGEDVELSMNEGGEGRVGEFESGEVEVVVPG